MNEEQLREFAESRVGTVLCEKWTLESLLGVGGTASVYSAMHRNGKRVAVKVLHPELSAQKQFRDRFLREGYVGNHIEHDGAITVHDDAVLDDGCVMLVMDLLEGENLEARRERKGGRLGPIEVLSLMDDILDTLAAAHERGVVHRDIKPENLFLTTDNQVKLLDFGIARIDVADDPGKTLAGIAMGTPAFMPPEQASARWEQVGGQSDLWALGASMFTLLTGRYVHEGGTVNESLAMAVTRSAPLIETVDPELPPAICAIVNKALCRDQSMRWATAAEMQIAVRQAYKDLQETSDEQQRYSLSHGSVSSHSAPPLGVITPSKGVTTGDPVSTSLVATSGRGSRKTAIVAAVALGFVVAAVAVVGGDDSDEDEVTSARAAPVAVPTVISPEPEPIEISEPESLPRAEPVPEDRVPKLAGDEAQDDETPTDETQTEATKKRRRWVPKKPGGDDFDPFEKRD